MAPEVVAHVARRELRSTTVDGDCVVSTRSLNSDGYRESKYQGRYVGMAHRIVYTDAVGEIPQGMTVDHLCRRRACLNVRHMELVTLRVNIDRALAIKRKEVTTRGGCVNGHPWSDENTYTHGGTRYCRACNRAAQQRRAARKAVTA